MALTQMPKHPHSNSMCRQSSIPTSILMELFASGSDLVAAHRMCAENVAGCTRTTVQATLAALRMQEWGKKRRGMAAVMVREYTGGGAGARTCAEPG